MKNWTKPEKTVYFAVLTFSVFLGLTEDVSAMHIMEGYLPLVHCILWGVICLPFAAHGFITLKHISIEKPQTMILLAMSGAFIFVISSLKIPSVTGRCSHMTGTGLSAILFGVSSASVLGIIVLIFQAVLLAHGGLTTLGANTFSMAIAGPILAFLIYRLGQKRNINRKITVFFAAALGDIFTYCITSLQLALAYPSNEGGIIFSAGKFLGVFAPTQIPLAVMEGLITVLVVMGMENFALPELRALGFVGKEEL